MVQYQQRLYSFEPPSNCGRILLQEEMSKPTKDVDGALSSGPGEPWKNPLKYGSSSKDSSWEAKIYKIPSKKRVKVYKILHEKHAARLQAGRLVDEANKAPETPLPAPSTPALPKEVRKSDTGTTPPCSNQPVSTPVPPQEVPKSDTGATPPSSNQTVPTAKPNHCNTSSTPLTGADPISGVAGGVGGNSFELSLIQLKERLTHQLMQNIAFADELGRQAIFWEGRQAESDAKIKKVHADLKKAEEALAISASQMKEVLAKHKKEMESKDQKLAALTKESNKEKEQQFNLGKMQGREEFLQSEEFQSMLKKAREDGVLDFKKSPEFINLSKAVDHVMTAFNNCRAQLFDASKPDIIKTGNCWAQFFDVSKPDIVKTESSGKAEDDLPPSRFEFGTLWDDLLDSTKEGHDAKVTRTIS